MQEGDVTMTGLTRNDPSWCAKFQTGLVPYTREEGCTRTNHDLKLVSLALPDSAALEVTLQADE